MWNGDILRNIYLALSLFPQGAPKTPHLLMLGWEEYLLLLFKWPLNHTWKHRGKEPTWNAGHEKDAGLILVLERSPGRGNGNLLQYFCLENPMERGAWQPAVQSVAKNWTWLSTQPLSQTWFYLYLLSAFLLLYYIIHSALSCVYFFSLTHAYLPIFLSRRVRV